MVAPHQAARWAREARCGVTHRPTMDDMKRVRDGHLWYGLRRPRSSLRAVGEVVEVLERDAKGPPLRWLVRIGSGVVEYGREPSETP